MDIQSVSDNIEAKIDQLDKVRLEIRKLTEDKAEVVGEYDKELAKIIIRLRNQESINVDGEEIRNPPATVMGQIAKGALWELAIKKDTAEAMYKNAIKVADILQSQLNGWQSIYRHLDAK